MLFTGNEELPCQWRSDFESVYEERQDLGRGRFAVVKMCINKEDGQEVAAKFVNPKLIGQDAVAMEIDILQKLQHENVVTFIDAFETPTNHIIILN